MEQSLLTDVGDCVTVMNEVNGEYLAYSSITYPIVNVLSNSATESSNMTIPDSTDDSPSNIMLFNPIPDLANCP